MIGMRFSAFAICVGCGRAFQVVDPSQIRSELSPMGMRYLFGVCSECQSIADEVQADLDQVKLTEVEKRYVAEPDEDSTRLAKIADDLADIFGVVWHEEAWQRVEDHIDRAIRLMDQRDEKPGWGS